MPEITFTANLQRHVASPKMQVEGSTVREVLDKVFAEYPILRGYVLDEQLALRKHMGIIVDGVVLCDRVKQSDRVGEESRIFVLQALSGG